MGLYISVTTASADSKHSPVNEAITRLAASAALGARQGVIPNGPSLDVTFMLPGQFDKPPFSGMRMGGYTQQGDTLYFEKAVPDHIMGSDEAGRFVALVMQDVIAHAKSFFEEQAQAFDLEAWQAAMNRLTESTPIGVKKAH